jgi:hypothetical protein
MFVRIATAAAALTLISGVAMAQSTAPQAGMPVNPDPTAAAPADQTMPADPAATTATPPADPTAATTMPAPTGAATDTAGVMTSSSSPETQATLKAGDANVVSNPPVADTPENRKLYGKPLSNAGKHSAAKGN